jgi:hypothetical protein
MHARLVTSTLVIALLGMSAAPALAATDPNVLCHRTVVKQLEKYKKTYLKLHQKCLDKENLGKIPDCSDQGLDSVSASKLALANQKVAAAIAKKCQMANLTAVGFRSDCQYGAATPGIGGTCFNLPVTNATEFAECMKCWKRAEFGRYMATIYASHAVEQCGALDSTSTACSALGCTSPTPEQRDLGDNSENDCQRALGKASVNYLLKRERILENCMLKGGTRGSCLADLKVQLQLSKAETQKETLIENFCNNRQPVASPPFCCRNGVGQQCTTLPVSRDDCVMNFAGTVQENKFCNVDMCDNTPGPNKPFTWWEQCPTNEPCPAPTMTDIGGVIDCVDSTADKLIDGLLCLQFPNGAACPTPVLTPTPTPTSTP